MVRGLVSVITPTYNRPNYLRQAIESVLDQTYPAIELIIVDDGSDDNGANTKAVLAPYLSCSNLSHQPKITYLYQPNQGIGNAVNRGLVVARGEYIQRLDDDDRLLPEKISRSIEVLENRPEVGLVATGYHHIDATGNRIHTIPPNRCPSPARLLNMLMRCITTCAGVIVRSEVHQKVGQYRNIRAQDYEMWIRVAKAYEIETIDEPLVEYRKHPKSITHNRQAELEQDMLAFIKEHIRTTPLGVLVPNVRSEPHAYALRAALYLMRDKAHARSVTFAKAELEKGLRLDSQDALLFLWGGILAVHGDRSLLRYSSVGDFPSTYESKAKELANFVSEREALSAKKLNPLSPEMVSFRQRFSKFCGILTQETFNKAIGR